MSVDAPAIALQARTTRRALLPRFGRLAQRKPLGALSLLLIVVMAVMALGAELLSPYDPFAMHPDNRLELPSAQYLLGTDNFGRDVLSRAVHGARLSLFVGLSSVIIGVGVGSLLGLVSAFAEGKTDLIIQRVMDAQMAFPSIILALAIMAAVGPGLMNVILAIGVAGIPWADRVVRAAVLSEKQGVYVEAARSIGCGLPRILFRHILPNVTAPIIVIASVTLGSAILFEASLTFLGVGTPPSIPSWGEMLSGKGRQFMVVQPWIAIAPGVAITLAVLGWNLLGDAIRDVWDPRLRGE